MCCLCCVDNFSLCARTGSVYNVLPVFVLTTLLSMRDRKCVELVACAAKVTLERKVEQLEKDHQELLNENLRITEDSHNLNNDLRKQLASLRLELQEALLLREAAAAEQAKAQQALQQQVELASEVSHYTGPQSA